jgi:sensor histidine kinase YesM
MFSDGSIDFSGELVMDFLYRYIFFAIFSYLIIQMNANLVYKTIKASHTVQLVVIVVLDLLISLLLLALYHFLYYHVMGAEIDRRDWGFVKFNYVVLTIVLFFIARVLRLQTDQQESKLENERLKQQNLQSELAALKNQIDPHFLFNSLNSLTSLIRDNKPATQFVNKLSHMYRYILQSGDSNLVTVREELKYLESYAYLIETRYRDRFKLNIEINEAYLDEKLPPMALQLLVENAVKHNEISATHPLKVDIVQRNGSIFVENVIRPRTNLADGTKNGLINLKKRYALLLKQDLTIRQDNDIFSVELPLAKEV